MKQFTRTLVSVAAVLALSNAAYAANFQVVSSVGSGGYSATTDGNELSHAVQDISVPGGDIGLVGADTFNTSESTGSIDHSYSADGYLSFSQNSADLLMSVSQSLAVNASAPHTVHSHAQGAFIDLSAVTLKIAADSGETDGDAVTVRFVGSADAVYALDSLVNTAGLGMGLSVMRGNDVLAEYVWDAAAVGSQALDFSFNAVVGEELILSSFMLTGAELTNAQFAASPMPYVLAETAGSLQGRFTLTTAVPEPQTYALLLAGLGLMVSARRRASSM